MPLTGTVLFPPPLRHSDLAEPIQKWLLTVQNLHEMQEGDTSKGNEVFTLPPAGLNAATGQSNQNKEYVVLKTTPDANTVTIQGLPGQLPSGPVVLTTDSGATSVARFKSNGSLWRRVDA